jgi:membrane carboxypeptidase/penicillin-binding protein PbpC
MVTGRPVQEDRKFHENHQVNPDAVATFAGQTMNNRPLQQGFATVAMACPLSTMPPMPVKS